MTTHARNNVRAGVIVMVAGAAAVGIGGRAAQAQPCTTSGWTQITTATEPSPRWSAAMAYDAKRQRIVMFGGAVPLPEQGSLDETWEFDGTDWTLITPVGPTPGPTAGYEMVYDSVREVCLLQRGTVTWTWDGVAWAQVSTTGPSASALAFDSIRGVLVVYSFSGQTTEWDGTNWTVRTPPAPPFPEEDDGPGRRDHIAACFDAAREQTLIVGGSTDELRWTNDTWSWNGDTWTLLDIPPIGARRSYAVAYDSVRDVTLVFGGYQTRFESPLGDTWEFDGTWTQVTDSGPQDRGNAAMAFDIARNQMVLFGGEWGFFPGTWVYRVENLGGPTITEQPIGIAIGVGEDVTFSVVAEGNGPLTYQWRFNGEPIVDGDGTSGATTDMLLITDVRAEDKGVYDVVVTGACGSVTSDEAVLILEVCPADFTGDGVVNSQDFFNFLGAFFDQDPLADFDGSGTIDSNDFFNYVTAFFSGCGT